MIQRFLFNIVKNGFEQLRDDPALIADVFAQYNLSSTEVDAIETALLTKFPIIKHQYARTDDESPVISIILGNESETDHYLGDFAKQDPDGTETKSAIWKHSYELWVYAEHPDFTLYLYEMLKAILLSAPLEDCGLFEAHFKGMDLANDPRYVPEHLFARKFVVDASREFERVDRDSRLGKAFKVAGIHLDSSGSPSDVGGVKTLVSTFTPDEE